MHNLTRTDLPRTPTGFPIFGDVPSECRLHFVKDGRHAPHLQLGEWAVVDTDDWQIEFGVLYLIEQRSGPIIWQVSKFPLNFYRSRTQSDRPCAMVNPLNRPRSFDEAMEALNETPFRQVSNLHLSDGPIFVDDLEEQIIGRVIGVYQAQFDVLRRSTSDSPAKWSHCAPRRGGGPFFGCSLPISPFFLRRLRLASAGCFLAPDSPKIRIFQYSCKKN